MPRLQALQYPEMDPPQESLRKFALFFDTVASLVPLEERENLSPKTREFAQYIPDAYEPVEPPEDPSVAFDTNVRSVLDSAFALIEEEREGRLPGTKILKRNGRGFLSFEIVFEGGGMRVKDSAFLHDSKIPPDIRKSLAQHHLLLPKSFALIDHRAFEGFTLVEQRAADLILSHVADHVARQRGWDTIATSQLDFAACSASHIRRIKSTAAETADLASALISVLIPAGIQNLDIYSYMELRKAYEGVRHPFDQLVRELGTGGRLWKIADAEKFEVRIKEVVAEFEEEINKVRTTKLARNIKSWVPFAVTQLLSVSAGVFSGHPEVSFALSGGAATVALLDKKMSVGIPQSGHTDTYQQLASLQGDVSRYLKRLL
jgi:hypothetical protein